MEYHLVTLHVSDLEESLRFYRDLLGVPVAEAFGGGSGPRIAMLGQKGRPNVELIQTGRAVPEPRGQGVSVGFLTGDLDGLLSRIRAGSDAPITGPVSPNPHLRFYFVTDPDGYQVQLMEQQDGQ